MPPGKRPPADFLGLSWCSLTAATQGTGGVGSRLPPKPSFPLYCTISKRKEVDKEALVSTGQAMLVQVCSWTQDYFKKCWSTELHTVEDKHA